MRFIVTGEFDEGVEMTNELLDAYVRAIELLRKWQAEGIVESYEFFADRIGGYAVYRAASHEALEEILESVPLLDFDPFTLTIAELLDASEGAARDLVSRQTSALP